ncbi:twin-arginine translocation signal domain-containing protein [Halorubrum ezzemoulense]|uniref:twin-arginine translocation signal domain-containing protein n=1 Tax=Halorubrum ezzemoulense TaxID=337243 RepID=UPI0011407C4C|nr:twin-arginine translocation signal domain-containing protein [Halorubrum ezzemoulense]
MTQTQHNNTDGTGEQADNQDYSVDEDARSHEQAVDDHESAINRRTFVKAAGATAGGLALGTGNVAAQSDGGWLDALPDDWQIGAGATMTAAAGLPIIGAGVSAAYFGGKAVADVLGSLDDGASASTVHDSLYNDALLLEKNVAEAINEAQNEIDQTAALSRAEAKSIAFKAISNGASESEASTKATERIDQYYAGVQEAFYRAQEHSVLQLESYLTTISNTSNLTVGDVFQATYPDLVVGGVNFSDVDVSLIDGRTVTLRRATWVDDGSNSQSDLYYYGSGATNQGLNSTTGSATSPMYLYALNSAGDNAGTDDQAEVFPYGSVNNDFGGDWGYNEQYASYDNIDSQIKTARDNAQSDVSTIITDVFANYTQDQLSDVDDFISPIGRTLLSTEDFTETGAPVYPQMVAGEMGTTTSQAGYSLTIDYEPSTGAGTDGNSGTSDDTFGSIQTLNGTLWGFKPASGNAISTGTTYLTREDNSEGNVAYFSSVNDSGEVNEHELDGRFTVTDIKTGDGSSVDTVGTYDTSFTTADVSNLIEQIQAVIDRRDEENTEAPQPPGGGGGFFSDGLPWWVQITGVGGIAYILYETFGKDDKGGKGGNQFA